MFQKVKAKCPDNKNDVKNTRTITKINTMRKYLGRLEIKKKLKKRIELSPTPQRQKTT